MPKGPKSQKRPAGVIGNAPDRVGRRRTKGEKQLQAESISLTPVFPQIRSYEKGSPPFGSDPPLASAPWPDHLPVFFTVSTIAVFERAIATETGINWPLLSIPPLFPSIGLLCFQGGGGGRRSGATSRCPGRSGRSAKAGADRGSRMARFPSHPIENKKRTSRADPAARRRLSARGPGRLVYKTPSRISDPAGRHPGCGRPRADWPNPPPTERMPDVDIR